MNHIFVSYSRKDEAAVTKIVSALKEKGYPIWQDTSGPASGIPFSTKWFDIIEEAVYSASGAIIFHSENWEASGPCQDEYELMQKTGKEDCLMVIETADIEDGFEQILQEAETFIDRIRNDRGYGYRTQVFASAYAMKNGADPYQLVETHNGVRSGIQYMVLVFRMFFERDDLKDYDPEFFPYIDRYLKFAVRTALTRVFSLVLGLVLIGTAAAYAWAARGEIHQGEFRLRSTLNDYSSIRNMQDLRHKDLITAIDTFNDTHAYTAVMDTVHSVIANAVQLQNTDMPAIVSLDNDPAYFVQKSSGSSDRYTVSFSDNAGSFYLEDHLQNTVQTVSTPSPVTCHGWNHDGTVLSYSCGRKIFVFCPSSDTTPMRLSESIYPVTEIGFYEIEGKEMLAASVRDHLTLFYEIPFETQPFSGNEISSGYLTPSGTALYISGGIISINQNNQDIRTIDVLPAGAVPAELAVHQDACFAVTYEHNSEHHLLIGDPAGKAVINDLVLTEQLDGIVFSADGSAVFGYSGDELFRISCADGRVIRRKTDGPVLAVCPYGDGIAVHTGSSVSLYDINLKTKKKNTVQISEIPDRTDFLMASAGEHLFASSVSPGRYISFDHIDVAEKKNETIYFDAVQDYAGISAVSAGADEQYILFGYDDGTVRIFQDNGQYMIYEDRPVFEKIAALTCDPDSGKLTVLGISGSLYQLEIQLPALNTEFVGTTMEGMKVISDMLTEKGNRYYQGIRD